MKIKKKILKRLINILGYEPDKLIYELDLSPEVIERYLPEAFQKKFYELKGKLDKAYETINKLVEENKKLRDEHIEREKQLAFIQEKVIEKHRLMNRFPLFFSTKLSLVSALSNNEYFADSEGKFWKQWAGILLENTNAGLCFRFILTNPGSKEYVILPKQPIPFRYFTYMFDEGTLIADAKSGKVPIFLTKSGEFITPRLIGSEDEINELNKKLKKNKEFAEIIDIDLRHILKDADDDVRKAFLLLYNRYIDALNAYKKASIRAKNLLAKKIEAEIASEASSKAYESSVSALELLANKLESASSRLSTTILSEQEARMTQAAMESMFESLWKTINKIKERIQLEGIPDKEKAREELLSDLTFILEHLERLKPIEVVTKEKEGKEK